MNEERLGQVLLVKAVEETDRSGELLPLADREHATREVVRADDAAAAARAAAEAPGQRVLGLLGERAARLVGPLVQRYPVLATVLGRSRPPGWLTPLLVALALATGFVLASLDGSHRIEILAFPFLGVVAWNLAVYALVIAHAWGRHDDTRLPAWLQRVVTRGLAGLVDRTAGVHVKLGEVVARYAADWAIVGGPLLASELRRLFHLGAAVLALGMILGLYLRGIVFRYEAGWESTFLGPAAVRRLLGLVFGPASMLTGIALPDTNEAVAALRWTPAGGADAAPWIHLVAATLALYVVVPRLLLVLLERLAAWRWRRASRLPPALLAYARATLGATHAGGRGAIRVLPYARVVDATAEAALRRWAEATYGRGVAIELDAPTRYGDEAALATALAPVAGTGTGSPDGARPSVAPDALVLLLSLATTPEAENHGLAIRALRDAARADARGPEPRVLIDEAAYAARFAGDVAGAVRLDERRRLWREFVQGHGLEASFANLAATS